MDEAKKPADPFRRRVAYVIVAVSVLGAVVSWQAALAAEDADDREQQAAQERFLREGFLNTSHSDVSHDLAVLAEYEEHFERQGVLSNLLNNEGLDASRRQALEFENTAALRAFQTLNAFFISQPVGREDGGRTVRYDPASALAAGAPFGSDFRPDLAAAAAEESRGEAVGYLRAAALLAASLLFLTLAQVAGAVLRQRFAIVGVVVALAAVAQFVLA